MFVTGAYVLPHPEKMAKGGEDWFFIADSMRAMGVADGVGGWVSDVAPGAAAGGGGGAILEDGAATTMATMVMRALSPVAQAEVGVDAGAYARQLMGHAKDHADKVTATGSAEYKNLCSSLNAAGSTSGQVDVTADSQAVQLQQTILEKAYYKTEVRGAPLRSCARREQCGTRPAVSGSARVCGGGGGRWWRAHQPRRQQQQQPPARLASAGWQGGSAGGCCAWRGVPRDAALRSRLWGACGCASPAATVTRAVPGRRGG